MCPLPPQGREGRDFCLFCLFCRCSSRGTVGAKRKHKHRSRCFASANSLPPSQVEPYVQTRKLRQKLQPGELGSKHRTRLSPSAVPLPSLEPSVYSPSSSGLGAITPRADHHFLLLLQVCASGEKRGRSSFTRLHLSNETFVTTLEKEFALQAIQLRSKLTNHRLVAGSSRTRGEVRRKRPGPGFPRPASRLRGRPPSSREVQEELAHLPRGV